MTRKTLARQIHLLAIYQILGGLMGLGVTLVFAFKMGTLSSILLIVGIGFFMLYAFSVYAGYDLLKKGEGALNLSYVNQLLQILSFSFFGLTFKYSSGPFFNIGMDLTNSFLLNFDVGISTWSFEINGDDRTYFAINIVAIVLLFYISKLKNKALLINDKLFTESD